MMDGRGMKQKHKPAWVIAAQWILVHMLDEEDKRCGQRLARGHKTRQ
jgi:hypothetical protein